MAKYNTQHDIPYLKFLQFSEEIAEHSEDPIFIADKVMELFYPNVTDNEALYVEEFSLALKKNPKRLIKYRIDLKQLNKADNFIDADTFKHEKDFEKLLKMIVKSYIPFKKVDVNKISLADGQRIMSFFVELERIKKPFQYLFDPPVKASVGVITEGATARKEFAEHYGSHIEIVYAICKGDFLKMEGVMKWKTEKYLFIGEYLIRKRDTENIK